MIFVAWVSFSKWVLFMRMQACHCSVGSNGEFEKQLDFSTSEAIDLYTV